MTEDKPTITSDDLIDPEENARIAHMEENPTFHKQSNTTLDKFEIQYLRIAAFYEYDSLTGKLVSHRKPRPTERKGKKRKRRKRKEPLAKVISHHPDKTIQIQSGGRYNRKTMNLSPLKLCFLLGHGWIPPRVYTLNGDRTDWRLENLSPLPPAATEDTLEDTLEDNSLLKGITITKSSERVKSDDLFEGITFHDPEPKSDSLFKGITFCDTKESTDENS